MLQENLWEDSLRQVYLLDVRKLCIDNPCQAVIPLLIAFSITEFWNSTLQNAEKNLSLLCLRTRTFLTLETIKRPIFRDFIGPLKSLSLLLSLWLVLLIDKVVLSFLSLLCCSSAIFVFLRCVSSTSFGFLIQWLKLGCEDLVSCDFG